MCPNQAKLRKHKLTHNPQLLSAQNLFIAYSGGMDSHVLLHLCAIDNQLKAKITAIYVNHGLQDEAESWSKHCEQVCGNLGVKFLSLKADAKAKSGESPEEAARNARYAALKPLLAEADVLLVAQHADDQLETVLLQLFRGSGLKGLSGMPPSMAFGKGKVIRPLLEVPKAEIIDYATIHGLKWIEDPSNQHKHFDRNLLRNDIIPLVKQRWPALELTVSRSARHCADAQKLLANLADEGLKAALNPDDNTLVISQLQSSPLLQQRIIVRQWFQFLGVRMPSEAIVQRILAEVVAARDDANPVVLTKVYSIRRYRDALYCLKPYLNKAGDTLFWPADQDFLQLTDDKVYEIVVADKGIPCEQWRNALVSVRFRAGGETIELPGRTGHHELKKLFQEVGIPPWEREMIPLVYLDSKLAAVGEHWLSAEFYRETEGFACFRISRTVISDTVKVGKVAPPHPGFSGASSAKLGGRPSREKGYSH